MREHLDPGVAKALSDRAWCESCEAVHDGRCPIERLRAGEKHVKVRNGAEAGAMAAAGFLTLDHGHTWFAAEYLVAEGWWHPNVKGGQVHDHKPNQPATMHRLCEPVYTKRGGR